MALTFFWRCEGLTLDGTHDFTAGDNTATANSGAVIDAAAALVGSNGISIPTTADQMRFDPASIIDRLVGSVAFLLRTPTTLGTTGAGYFFVRGAASALDFISVSLIASQELRLEIRENTAGNVFLDTTTANIAADTTYGIVIRWDQPNNKRCIEVYDSGSSLIQKVEDTTTAYTAPAALDSGDGLRWGDFSGAGFQPFYLDNCFAANSYDEPLQNNLFITSYTAYSAGGSPPPAPTLFLTRSNLRMN